MSCTTDEQALIEQFGEQYRLGQKPIMREIERVVCGCDYGSTSWTTQREAEQIGELLALAPGTRLLDLGAGSGWPGLYLARMTGCDVTLVDVPLEGLRIAAARGLADRLSGAWSVVAADGAALPFRSGWFDAIGHSDVLCCLLAKLAVLKDCRRVIRPGGRMVFTVISIAPGLSPADTARVVECAPPFAETSDDYPTMLRQAGWEIAAHIDVTAEFAETARRLIREEGARADELRKIFGGRELSERLARKRSTVRVVEEGLLRRELFAATTPAVPPSGPEA